MATPSRYHWLPVALLDVSPTPLPHDVVEPLAVMDGVAGGVAMKTAVSAEGGPPPVGAVTGARRRWGPAPVPRRVRAAVTEMDGVVARLFQKSDARDDGVSVPEPLGQSV